MSAFFYLLALTAVGLCTSVGVTFLIIRKTDLAEFLFECSLILYPILIVLFHSLFGYAYPQSLPKWSVITFLRNSRGFWLCLPVYLFSYD
jgi:hypothetical protein